MKRYKYNEQNKRAFITIPFFFYPICDNIWFILILYSLIVLKQEYNHDQLARRWYKIEIIIQSKTAFLINIEQYSANIFIVYYHLSFVFQITIFHQWTNHKYLSMKVVIKKEPVSLQSLCELHRCTPSIFGLVLDSFRWSKPFKL